MKFQAGMLVILFGAVSAQAQTINDLAALVQQSRVVINNNASIDEFNPETMTFATDIVGQLVELNLNATRLNDSFITAINFTSPTRKVGTKAAGASGPGRVVQTNIIFGSLQVVLDGCDITSALLSYCNTNQCWATNPSTPMTAFTGVFGTQINLNLSALNPQAITGCTGFTGTSFFDAAHPTHTLTFNETVTGQGKGGSLNYQVIIFHKAF